MKNSHTKIEGIQFKLKSSSSTNSNIINIFSEIEIEEEEVPYKKYLYNIYDIYNAYTIISDNRYDFINGLNITILVSPKNKKKIYNILKKYISDNIIVSVNCKKYFYSISKKVKRENEKEYEIRNIIDVTYLTASKWNIYKCKNIFINKKVATKDKHNKMKNNKRSRSEKKMVYYINVSIRFSKESNITKNSVFKKKKFLKMLKEITYIASHITNATLSYKDRKI